MDALKIEAVETERLSLVPLAVEHADEMAEVLSDPALHAFTGGTPYSAQALRSRYARLVAGSPHASQTWWNWVIRLRAEKRLVGTVQATITGGEFERAAEVAWVVGTRWQGRGIATEAARALVAWLREQEVGAIRAHIHPDHHASAAVAGAAGLAPTSHRHEGEIRWELPATRPSADRF
ncbi:Protein N-acetyltransferase, RimJ/RimL family [Streptomyces sp. 1222.5]|uniref:GNAT family N-acetyltransferase n=1 Tax=unclassified Streptomyces TaxID=2593676 RepID=UPI00089B2FF1|nr:MULTISPECIES: GNAT family N-acetyltransferase [unclassified Streptomyces]PKW12343.1 RimJ/RimL family protein N-acetyltransferase [Streptomyces sp. 5112.2]SEB58012.1 Protein N-acetyltransferase, RimJ/RimL family [Streptomyces sp. 1222.5]